MVECDLAKVEVAGSTPVSRSINLLAIVPRTSEGLCSQGQQRRHPRTGRGTQVVRERSAKPLCVGSIPTRASKALIAHYGRLYLGDDRTVLLNVAHSNHQRPRNHLHENVMIGRTSMVPNRAPGIFVAIFVASSMLPASTR